MAGLGAGAIALSGELRGAWLEGFGGARCFFHWVNYVMVSGGVDLLVKIDLPEETFLQKVGQFC